MVPTRFLKLAGASGCTRLGVGEVGVSLYGIFVNS